MNPLLITCVVVNVLVYLVWCGYHYLSALGAAFGNTASHTGVDLTLVLIGGAVLTVAVGGVVWFLPGGVARIVMVLPLVYVLVAQGFIWHYSKRARDAAAEHRLAHRQTALQQIADLPRDFICEDPEALPPGRLLSFLIVDHERRQLARIDVEYDGGVDSYGIGRLVDGQLELCGREADAQSFYRHYRNADGQSVFDVFTVTFDADARYAAYKLPPAAVRPAK